VVLITYPNALKIFLTKRCNLGCRYCFVNKDSPNDKELSVDSFKRGVELFLAFPGSKKIISFNGGEPFLRFGKMKRLYGYMQHRINGKVKLAVAVVSNGTLLNENRYQFLKKNGIILKVSIDGKKGVHDFNRPFKFEKYISSYDRIIGNLKRFHNKDGYKINAQLVFTPFIIKNLSENIQSLWRQGFDYIDFYPDLYARWSKDELDRTEREFRKFVDFYISIFKNAKDIKDIFENSLLHTFVKELELYKPVICQKVHLDRNGYFYCCDKVFSLPESERKEFIIGDIHKGIDNRLRLRLLEQKRKEIRNLTGNDCRTCKYLKFCFCPVGHYIYFSSYGLDFKKYFPQFCRLSQIYIQSFLEIKRYLQPRPLFAKVYSN